MKKTMIVIAGLMCLVTGMTANASSAKTDGWQAGTNASDQSVTGTDTTGQSGDIGLLGYVGNVTTKDREVDIDGDGMTEYIVPENDFISASVTLEIFAVATIKADDTPDFRCGTIAVMNENEKRPVSVKIKEVHVQGLNLVSWNSISSQNADTKKELAIKVKPVRENDFAVTDAEEIGKTGLNSYLTVSDSLKGAIGYTLDGNYTNEMIEENKDAKLPTIQFVYSITPGV